MIRVVWSGNGVAERVGHVPIERLPGLGQVVMSLARGRDAENSLPDLRPGDRLEISVELEVTTDLTNDELRINHGQGCYSKPYDYPPTVSASVILGVAETSTTPAPGTMTAATKTVAVSHDAHHFVFVFNRAPVVVPTNWRGRGSVNVILRANHTSATAGHCLLVGANEPDGTVQKDMGSISVSRIRGTLAAPRVTREEQLRNRALSIRGDQPPRVLYSMPLTGLEANEQLTIYGRVLPSTAGLRTRARLSTRVFLADSPAQLEPQDGYAAQIAANKGRVAKNNGFNYLPGGSAPPTEKVGVVHIVEAMKPEKTVHLNLVGAGGDPSKKARAGDQLQIRPGGFLLARRFPAAAYG
jgi:hypothetical protein